MADINLLEKISVNYGHLTKSSRKIADYISSHAEEAQYLSISSLAKACGVAEATIFRFCRALGFGGYNELKIALAQSNAAAVKGFNYETYGSVQPDDDLETLCSRVYSANMDALHKTRAQLDLAAVCSAVDLLQTAGRVYCLGQGGSQLMAMDVWGRFLPISDKFYTVQDTHLQVLTASLLHERDVVLYFSYSGATRDFQDILRPACARGAKVILVTRHSDSAAAQLADVVLQVGGEEGPMQSGSIPAKMAMLFVADVLVNEFTRRDMDAVVRNRNVTSSALSSRML